VLNIANVGALCVDASPVTINATPAGGVLTGPGVSGNTFNPALAGVGTHTLSYSYTDANGCSNTTSNQITVHPLPTIEISAPTALCVDWDLQLLNATPVGGIFTYNNNAVTTINPASLGVGNHTFTYTVNNNFGCTNAATHNVNINALPNVEFNILDDLCFNSLFYPFTEYAVSPVGGTISFSGPGVQNNGILAADAGIGLHNITLNYTDPNGCENSATSTILVNGSSSALLISSAVTTIVRGSPVTKSRPRSSADVSSGIGNAVPTVVLISSAVLSPSINEYSFLTN
jgi:hypothetical protein